MSFFTSRCLVLIMLMVGLYPSVAFARQALWPTDLTSTGDCLSARITAPMNNMQTQVDKKYCSDGNQGQPEAIAECIKNSAMKTEVVFFSDTCGSEGEGIATVSMNGVEYKVKRTTPEAPQKTQYFYGTYKGQGITVTIGRGVLISDSAATNDDPSDLKTIEMTVPVTLSKGKDKQKVVGTLSSFSGPDIPPSDNSDD